MIWGMENSAKIYVAGHRGLVGSAIWNNLTQKGYSNLIGRTHRELDLMDSEAVARFFEEVKPEYVFLAAAHVGGIVANNTYRADFIYRNLQIQNNVIGESWRHGVKKLLFLGSTCIYPKETPQPMREDSLLTGPLEYTNEPYAIAKIAGLKMCESFNLQYGTNFIAVMPTNLYGPNDNFDLERSHVLPAMIRKIHLAKCLMEGNMEAIREDLLRRPMEGVGAPDGVGARESVGAPEGVGNGASVMDVTGAKETNEAVTDEQIISLLHKYGITENGLSLWGTGTPLREFLWSEEMADACVYIMEQVDFADPKGTGPDVRNCHINIGTGREISIRDLACLIKKTIGYDGEISFDASKPDGTMRKLTDVTKLNNLGWKHSIEIEEGVQRLVAWYLQ